MPSLMLTAGFALLTVLLATAWALLVADGMDDPPARVETRDLRTW